MPNKYPPIPNGVSSDDIQKARQRAKRTRVTAACTRCKSAKIRCSDYRPCKHCVGSNKGDECVESNEEESESNVVHSVSMGFKDFSRRQTRQRLDQTMNSNPNMESLVIPSQPIINFGSSTPLQPYPSQIQSSHRSMQHALHLAQSDFDTIPSVNISSFTTSFLQAQQVGAPSVPPLFISQPPSTTMFQPFLTPNLLPGSLAFPVVPSSAPVLPTAPAEPLPSLLQLFLSTPQRPSQSASSERLPPPLASILPPSSGRESGGFPAPPSGFPSPPGGLPPPPGGFPTPPGGLGFPPPSGGR
jgi:hypothetical protein